MEEMGNKQASSSLPGFTEEIKSERKETYQVL
jgi:hypothetical protein